MLVLLSGVSGSGKDTIKKEILKRVDNMEMLPSYTDREPRVGEKEEGKYVFVTRQEFEKMIEENEFYEYSMHHEHYYGVSKKLLNEKLKSGKIIIKDIDVNGAENLLKLLNDDVRILTIFLKVTKEALRKRLQAREDKPSLEKINLRLNRLEYEESKTGLYDYVIKNNDLNKTVNIINTIIENELNLVNPEF